MIERERPCLHDGADGTTTACSSLSHSVWLFPYVGRVPPISVPPTIIPQEYHTFQSASAVPSGEDVRARPVNTLLTLSLCCPVHNPLLLAVISTYTWGMVSWLRFAVLTGCVHVLFFVGNSPLSGDVRDPGSS